MLDADMLLAGSAMTAEVDIPESLLGIAATEDRRVRLKPLTVHDLRLINRAARDSDELTAALMVQRSLVQPELTIQQVSSMSAGMLEFLLQHVTRISGIHVTEQELSNAAQEPLTRATLELARELGWTPEQIGELTLGQVLLHLQVLRAQGRSHEYHA